MMFPLCKDINDKNRAVCLLCRQNDCDRNSFMTPARIVLIVTGWQSRLSEMLSITQKSTSNMIVRRWRRATGTATATGIKCLLNTAN